METTATRAEFVLDYVVIKSDGVNEYNAEAGFMNEGEAIEYAEKLAGYYDPFDPTDGEAACNSALVAHYEVVQVHGDGRDEEWDTVYETASFYNDWPGRGKGAPLN